MFKRFLITLLFVFTIPCNIYAYSDYIAVSGKNIGIHINTKGVMVVGLYNIDNVSPGVDAGINIGDYIIKINNEEIDNINDMINKIDKNKDNDIIVTYMHNNIEKNTNLKLVKKDGVYKTGLYVKDTINGVGTLTYIDPGTKMYGALGHAIIDRNTLEKVEIKDGKIYKSNVVGITKSIDGVPGEKNAEFFSNEIYGSINKNTFSGIFGSYYEDVNDKLYKVGKSDEIKKGNAKILTVLNGDIIDEYDINITNLNNEGIKNITFNITDKELLNKTGGIVQGMSGSPIIQDNKIIGAVTHVVVNNPTKGYGIFITNMLEEMEKEF